MKELQVSHPFKEHRLKLKKFLLKKFYRAIIDSWEENMQGDRISIKLHRGRARKVDMVQLECGHTFWQEKNQPLDQKVCEVCWNEFCFINLTRIGMIDREWIHTLVDWGWRKVNRL